MNKKNTPKIIIAAGIGSILVPFIAIPNQAQLFASALMLIYGTLILAYHVSQVFMKETEEAIIERSFSGLPGEVNTNNAEPKQKKKRKVKIDNKLPGAFSKDSGSLVPEFDIIEETSAKSLIPSIEVAEDNLPNENEIIDFWDDFSSYKTKDSQVFKKANTKEIGELLDFVFTGIGTYLQRHRLTLDDVINLASIEPGSEEPTGRRAVGFIIYIIEQEFAKKEKINTGGFVSVLSPPGGESLVSKVISDKAFESQVIALVHKYYEKKKER